MYVTEFVTRSRTTPRCYAEAVVRKFVVSVVAAGVLLPFPILLFLSETPVLRLPASATVIGPATPFAVAVDDPHGVRSVHVYAEQGGARYDLYRTSFPSRRILWQRHLPAATFRFVAGTKTTPQLKDGKARLVAEAVSNDLRGSTATLEREITVITRPPSLSADSDQHYLYQGMADATTFDVSGYWTEAGVRVGDETFRSWPLPGDKTGAKPGRFALYAFAWNMPRSAVPTVYATNPAGTEVTVPLVVVFPAKEQPHYSTRDLDVSDAFMQKVVNELDPGGSGDPMTRFLKINGAMRRANNQTLSDLRNKTESRFLWSQPFLQQKNSKVESSFADVRNYIYHGKKIDRQVHLGYDLAITKHVGVEASNDGRVVYAAPLGIYGNCIVVDHGYGLQSIYGHLSEIGVHEGDMVKRGQIMGRSGETGMAGGDHIHFTMQLDGVQIDPKEWFDAHWIRDHVAKRVEIPGFQ